MTDSNLGVIITNSKVRKAIYGIYVILGIIAGGTAIAYSSIKLGNPEWLTAATSVLAYLGIPVGSLAIANAPTATAATPTPITDPLSGQIASAPIQADAAVNQAAPAQVVALSSN